MDLFENHDNFDLRDSHVNMVQCVKVIDRSNWKILLYKESIAISKHSSLLNHILETSNYFESLLFCIFVRIYP
jgi:hypothetical protein